MPTAKARPPVDEAESVQQSLQAENYARRTAGPKVALPNGIRVDARPYIGMQYQGMDTTALLGNPEGILKEPRPGFKYVWKLKTNKQTSAWVRSGVLRPVELEEVDTSNPLAEFVEDPAGKYVVWETLALFEMPPKWVKKMYTGPEEWAIARLAQQTQDFSQRVADATRGAYEGEMKITAK